MSALETFTNTLLVTCSRRSLPATSASTPAVAVNSGQLTAWEHNDATNRPAAYRLGITDCVRAFIDEVLDVYPLLQEGEIEAMLEEPFELDGTLSCLVGLGKLVRHLQSPQTVTIGHIPGEAEVLAFQERDQNPLSRARLLLLRAIFYRYAGSPSHVRRNLAKVVEMLTAPDAPQFAMKPICREWGPVLWVCGLLCMYVYSSIRMFRC